MNDVTDPVSGEEKVRFSSGGSRGFGFGESGGRPRRFDSISEQLTGRQVSVAFTAPLPEVAAGVEPSFRRRPVLDSPVGSTASGERR
ncbi:hypothetical protein OG585_03940 [Streptomyces sp. NBC_01340]|uniref:hypothetical protein n=1 Tax=unclassified Streptomyces TaxID=2593676 RepID=UPI0022599AD3|nr:MULTISPECIES: hypothetical protein [unclassified Streptomyces]MCX4451816.1 hypothetical protein [Streptomyces sp. NBC_01719]MCX4491176.1 hypothetical protein [Streptomyces sp. NBC_01728]MCX4594240.1 hypothetical protein [Streptomyces sp. NBC_01549]WSI36506.1 hypothetical protein OG585_03940 [Streptomyces sp. NBC_01340]